MSYKYYTVYKTTNNFNGRYYIGVHKTNDLNDKYLGSGLLITEAISQIGSKYFTREILFIFDNEIDMYNKEVEIVTFDFIQLFENYNVNVGGFYNFKDLDNTIKVINKENKVFLCSKDNELITNKTVLKFKLNKLQKTLDNLIIEQTKLVNPICEEIIINEEPIIQINEIIKKEENNIKPKTVKQPKEKVFKIKVPKEKIIKPKTVKQPKIKRNVLISHIDKNNNLLYPFECNSKINKFKYSNINHIQKIYNKIIYQQYYNFDNKTLIGMFNYCDDIYKFMLIDDELKILINDIPTNIKFNNNLITDNLQRFVNFYRELLTS